MANVDQAEGLRRMLAVPKPRVFTFLSALKDEEKSAMLVNLGVSLARQGQKITMLDARSAPSSIGTWLSAQNDISLLDVARQQRTMQEAIKIVASGLSVTMLSRKASMVSELSPETARQLSKVFDIVAQRADLVVVDVNLNDDNGFPLSALDHSEVVIQVSADPAAIKNAYGLIKRMSGRLGRRSFSILVSGVSEKEATLIYTNMAQAASRYLAVPLNYIGYVPEDDHVRKAASLGQSVIDAFPKARASVAFSRLATQLVESARSVMSFEGVPELGVGLGI
ncbi:MinD/ParA family ATP-binding protein [Undibacterium sp. RuRC25W]|uniref:MinD/ParA family ATP-binding protein n=1 Tax=Undibacterium sp. RuRC25W TaxID=3413047 RepID=UPI003BF44094